MKFQYLYDKIKFAFKRGYFVDIHPDLYNNSFHELSEYFVDYVKDKYRMKELKEVEFLSRDDAYNFELIWGLNYTSTIGIPEGWTSVILEEFPSIEIDMWIAKYIKDGSAYRMSPIRFSRDIMIFENPAEAAMFKLMWIGR